MRQNGSGVIRMKIRARGYFRDADVALKDAGMLAKDDAIASVNRKMREIR